MSACCECDGLCAREHTGPCPNHAGSLAAGSRWPTRLHVVAGRLLCSGCREPYSARTRVPLRGRTKLSCGEIRSHEQRRDPADHGYGQHHPRSLRTWQRCMRKWCRLGNERFTFHDLRAMAATRCPTIEMAMQLLGHSNISMTRRVYRRGIERVRPVAMSAVMNGAPREQSTQHS